MRLHETALRFTMKNYRETTITKSYISREEVYLLNKIAITYKNIGEKEKAIKDFMLRDSTEKYYKENYDSNDL